MDDRHENTFSMALVVDQTLDATQADWSHYGKLVTDAAALKTAIAGVTTATQRLKAAEAAGGEMDVKDAAEVRALDAAMVIVHGATSSVIDQPNAVLAGVAKWTRTALDHQRDTEQVDDLVTDDHFAELKAATAALRPLIGKARGEVVTAASLRREEAAAVNKVRQVLDRLDARMDVMRSHNKPLAERYFQARINVNLKGPGKRADGGAK